MGSGTRMDSGIQTQGDQPNARISVTLIALALTMAACSVTSSIDIPNMALSLTDLPALLTLIWFRWPYAVANIVMGACIGLIAWGVDDPTVWAASYLNTLLFIGFIIAIKRAYRQLGLTVVGIAYWLAIGVPLTFVLFSLQSTDNDYAIIASGQRLFSALVTIAAAISLHFTVILSQHRLPDFLFGGERRFTVRMREIAETAAIIAAAIPMLLLLWALIDRETEAEISALFAASDARFESLAQSAGANLQRQRQALESLTGLLGSSSPTDISTSRSFEEKLLTALNSQSAVGFVLQLQPHQPIGLSVSASQLGLSAAELTATFAGEQAIAAVTLTNDEQGPTGYMVSTQYPKFMLLYTTPADLWDALYGRDMLGLMSGLQDAGIIDRVSHFHGPSEQELYGIADESTIIREEYDYAIWIPPARTENLNRRLSRLEGLSKSYITFQASDELINSFDPELYDVDCFRYTVDLWSYLSGPLSNLSFFILTATGLLLFMASLIEFAVGRFSRPFLQLADAMEHFSASPTSKAQPLFAFDLTTGTSLFRYLAAGFNRMESAVNESTQRLVALNSSYESLLSRARIAFIAIDKAGHIEYANPTAETLLTVVENLTGSIETGINAESEVTPLTLTSKRGNLHLLVSETPRVNLAGDIDGKWLMASDISSLRSAERKLLEAQRLSTLGQLTTGMAHEISQPLQAMTLTLANLKRSLRNTFEQSPQTKEKLERIDSHVHKIGNLIKFMKTYGGISAANQTLFSLEDCLADAVTRHERNSPERLAIKLTNQTSSSISLLGDSEQFTLVLEHIIKNARDAAQTTAHNDPCTLDIAVLAQEDSWVITLSDNCGGIADDVMPYIFDPFFTTKDPDKGMGLGLSVSHGIISSMGGRISAENTENGVTFAICLPVDL